MLISIERSAISGQLHASPSKSYTHRAILISSLGQGGIIEAPLLSADTKATINACEAFGAKITIDHEIKIEGLAGKLQTPEDVINVMNSGTTLRFFTAIAGLTTGAVLTGDASIRARPNEPLLCALNELGARAFSIRRNGKAPLVVEGKISGGVATLDGSVSSQFLSALLITAPLAINDTCIIIKGELKSRPYAEITLEMLEKAGVLIKSHAQEFRVPGNQEYALPNYTIPGDFSSASYPLAAAALTNGELIYNGLFPSKQGDSAIVGILEQMGARISWNQERGELKVKGDGLNGIEMDASMTPDLVPTLAVLGSMADGSTIIKNAEHVRHKETDRLHAMAVELSKMGANIKERPDGLKIIGGKLHGASLHGYHDHRIVMALTVAGLTVGNTRIDTAETVDISYPGFFKDMTNLGAAMRII
jgi:3-phosphoshikimate 1-carboxyvinyltransferase